MSLLVLGMNHRSADVAVLERVAVPGDELGKALRALSSLEHVVEAAVLSTCNRVEVYAYVSRFHAGLDELVGWFASRSTGASQLPESAHYAYYDDRAAAHLFSVASGIDSLVVGERQIALQVKQAAVAARAENASRRVLHRLFDHALYASRRVRSETDISRGASSMVDLGLDAAAEAIGGSLAGRTVLIIGAGKLGGLSGGRLRAEGVGRVLVRNRTPAKAQRLAARVAGETVGDGGLRAAIAAADVVVCCASASSVVLDAELVVDALRRREPARPLVLLDLAMPRNVDPACAALLGVTTIDLDDVRGAVETTVAGEAMDAARAIVEEEATRFHSWLQAVRVDPTIRSLRNRAEAVRSAELERLANRLSGLDDRQREAVEALTRGIVNTLLHDPTVRLKALADGGGAEHYAMALRELFDLDE